MVVIDAVNSHFRWTVLKPICYRENLKDVFKCNSNSSKKKKKKNII
jgi:hypothetical protein